MTDKVGDEATTEEAADNGIDLAANMEELSAAHEAAVKGTPTDEEEDVTSTDEGETEATEEDADADTEEELEEEAGDEPEQAMSHADKSWQGRKIKGAVDEATKDLRAENAELKDAINQLIGEVRGMQTEEPEEQGSDDDILTRGDLKKMIAEQNAESRKATEKTQAEAQQFEDNYLTIVAGLEDTMEPEEFKAVEKLMTAPDAKYNIIRHSDPKQDFEHNLSDAKLHILQGRKDTTKKPKLKGDSAKGKGVGGDSKVDTKDTQKKADISDPDAL